MLFTVVEGEGAGAKFLVEEGETGVELAEEADEVIRGARNTLLDLGDRKVFGEVYMPPPRLFVYGAVDTAEALCKAAKLLGWTTYVADARRAFATAERFPSADELIVEWPRGGDRPTSPPTTRPRSSCSPTTRSSTSPRCRPSLATEAFYIGALGSRRNQEKRRARLLEAGVPEEALAPHRRALRARHRRRVARRRPRSRSSARSSPCAPAAPAGACATPSAASTRKRTRPLPA